MEHSFPNKISYPKKVFLVPRMSSALVAIQLTLMRQKTGFEWDGTLRQSVSRHWPKKQFLLLHFITNFLIKIPNP